MKQTVTEINEAYEKRRETIIREYGMTKEGRAASKTASVEEPSQELVEGLMRRSYVTGYKDAQKKVGNANLELLEGISDTEVELIQEFRKIKGDKVQDSVIRAVKTAREIEADLLKKIGQMTKEHPIKKSLIGI